LGGSHFQHHVDELLHLSDQPGDFSGLGVDDGIKLLHGLE
jgi:hypothetical protein